MQRWPNIMQNRDAKKRQIDVVLFDKFSNHCLANAIEPLRVVNCLSRERLYSWRFLSIGGNGVVSSSGLPVMPEMALSHAEGGDYLIVMPSYDYLEHAKNENLRALRAATRKYKAVIGMDTGAWLLAAAGLLTARRATIHWDEFGNFAERFPEVNVVPDRYVIDGDRITCGGVTTTFDLILHLINHHHGQLLALEVTAMFMPGLRPNVGDLRLRDDEIINAAVSLMRRTIEHPLTIAELSARLNHSRKRLEAHFKEVLGRSPHEIYQSIRLWEARRLVEHSRYSISEIAIRCGYENPAAMTRAFRHKFGITPSLFRKAEMNV